MDVEERKIAVERELDVLKYFNNLELHRGLESRNHIIKMHGWKRRHSKMSFLLELGGNSLQDYYRQKIEDIYGENYRYNERVDEQLLINILKGAAQALHQFHQHGIHLDVKEDNFVIALDENQSEPNPDPGSNETIPVKLIDFNISVINSKGHVAHTEYIVDAIQAPELLNNPPLITNKADVWSFGLMAAGLFHNTNYETARENLAEYRDDTRYNGRLDQLIKACTRENPNSRPTMDSVVSFFEWATQRLQLKYFAIEKKTIEFQKNKEKVTEM
uniref:Protein kinase domain-containing protein n=1 Tax=Meloidogyne enterolobii TaxID=390850 RepID=A0A6V7TX36_MELEN|nr:unnamed protein product [Meloidogyne enterolobii]